MKKEKRNEEIYRMKKAGLTLQAIGDLLSLSRQRIHQIGMDMPPEKAYFFKKPRARLVNAACDTCKKNIAVPESRIGRSLSRLVFCSRPCYSTFRRIYESQRQRDMAIWERKKKRYQTDPIYREKYRKYQREYIQKKKAGEIVLAE